MTRTAKAQEYANRHGIIKYYTDADAFINDPDIDATYEALKIKKFPVCSLLLKDSASICANKKMIRHEQYWRSQTYQLEPMQTCL
jgi:hypothetical protein